MKGDYMAHAAFIIKMRRDSLKLAIILEIVLRATDIFLKLLGIKLLDHISMVFVYLNRKKAWRFRLIKFNKDNRNLI